MVVSQKIKNKIIIWFSNSIPGNTEKKKNPTNLKNLYTPTFIAALFTIAETWKQLKYLSKDEWVKKKWYTFTIEYYSAMKKNETLPFPTTWMDLEGIMLSEIS